MSDTEQAEFLEMTRKVAGWAERGVTFGRDEIDRLVGSLKRLVDPAGSAASDEGDDPVLEQATANRSG